MTTLFTFSANAQCSRCWHRHETEKRCRISRPEYPYHAYACRCFDEAPFDEGRALRESSRSSAEAGA